MAASPMLLFAANASSIACNIEKLTFNSQGAQVLFCIAASQFRTHFAARHTIIAFVLSIVIIVRVLQVCTHILEAD